MNEIEKAKEIKAMERVWKVYTHPLYMQNLRKNQEMESDRIFCKHDMEHFINVARLAYIFKLERQYLPTKEIIYVTALLHDIGKWKQYQEGIPHEIASAQIAEEILDALRFGQKEKKMIVDAILSHRNGREKSELAEIIYDGDKISRNCFSCEAQEACNWKEEKKNQRILW